MIEFVSKHKEHWLRSFSATESLLSLSDLALVSVLLSAAFLSMSEWVPRQGAIARSAKALLHENFEENIA